MPSMATPLVSCWAFAKVAWEEEYRPRPSTKHGVHLIIFPVILRGRCLCCLCCLCRAIEAVVVTFLPFSVSVVSLIYAASIFEASFKGLFLHFASKASREPRLHSRNVIWHSCIHDQNPHSLVIFYRMTDGSSIRWFGRTETQVLSPTLLTRHAT